MKSRNLTLLTFVAVMIHSVDEFAANILAVWQRNDVKPKGPATSFNAAVMEVSMDMTRGPLTFQDFVERSSVKDVSPGDLFRWYSRMQLRWSCSSLNCILYKHIIPLLGSETGFYSSIGGKNIVDLKGAKVCTVRFIPHSTHTINFNHWAVPSRSETIEVVNPVPHQFIQLQNGGVLDLTLGQFTGNMLQPKFYVSLGAYFDDLPGKVCSTVMVESEQAVDNQLRVDKETTALWDCKSIEGFVKQAVEGLSSGWNGICKNCFNVTRCREYCGNHCKDL